MYVTEIQCMNRFIFDKIKIQLLKDKLVWMSVSDKHLILYKN